MQNGVAPGRFDGFYIGLSLDEFPINDKYLITQTLDSMLPSVSCRFPCRELAPDDKNYTDLWRFTLR